MEEDYILISTLNDFIFCPYSIYLHNVYMESDEGLYHATPQTRGRNAHETIDTKKASNRVCDIQSLPIISEKYKLMGKIDIYRGKEKKLIERTIPTVYYMNIISYDIKDDKIRTKFAKMLRSQGAIRLQFSVYEVNNTQRIIDNIKINIVDKFSKLFTGDDSVLIFDAPNAKVEKFGNAIHRDKDIVYL